MTVQRRRGFTLLFSLLFLWTAGAAVHACMWDRDTDTLAQEARDLPELVHIITGRFERNPTLFYEMRLARVAKEIAADPDSLYLYDDAAVACDRLGRSGEAIVWIEKKRKRLERKMAQAGLNDPLAASGELREHWYRYHANIGTFMAHQWIGAGANRKRIGQMERARFHIACALALNPDAHFGRERYQYLAMEWLIRPAVPTVPMSAHRAVTLGQYVAHHTGTTPKDLEEAIAGLSGLVVLGNAWESVDVFAALSGQIGGQNKASLSYFAGLRVTELIDQGSRSLHVGIPSDRKKLKEFFGLVETPSLLAPGGPYHSSPGRPEAIEKMYRRLRAEAEAWHQRRTEFMLSRLKAGLHPDTHPSFWEGYQDTPPPAVPLDDTKAALEKQSDHPEMMLRFIVGGIVFALCLVLTPIALFLVQRRRRRQSHE